MTRIPLSGPNTGVFDPRQPSLLPQFQPHVANGDGTMSYESPQAFVNANPRLPAYATATIGGTVTTTDSIGLIVTSPALAIPVGVAYSAAAGDTVTTIAERLADAVNDNVTLQQVDVRADVVGAALTLRWGGPVGNFASLTSSVNPATVTDVIGGSASQGDFNVVQFSGPNFNGGVAHQVQTLVPSGRSTTNQAVDMAASITADTILSAASITASNSANTLQIAVPAAMEPLTVTAWSAPTGETAVISGSIVNADSFTFVITQASLSGGSLVLTIPVVTADTTTTVAAKLAAAIQGAPVAINAISSGANVNITWPGSLATPTFSRANGSSIVCTLGSGAFETATVGGTITNGDSFTFTVTNGNLPGGSATLTIPVVTGDTTTTVATKLFNAINASLPLQSIGMTALHAAAVVSIFWQPGQGAVTFSRVNGSTITATLAGGPTETHTVGGTVTETVVVGTGSTAVVAATATATIGGSSFVANDTVALTFTNAGVTGFPHTVTYTLSAGSSATIIATGLVALIAADSVLKAANVSASNAAGVITISQQGSIGSSTVLSQAVTGTGNETVTFSPTNGHLGGGAGTVGSALAGGAGPVIPYQNFSFSLGATVFYFQAGRPLLVDTNTLTALVNGGAAIV